MNWKDSQWDKQPFGKDACRSNVHWDKWLTGKYLVVQVASGSNGKFLKTSTVLNRQLERWLLVQMTGWEGGLLYKGPLGQMAYR